MSFGKYIKSKSFFVHLGISSIVAVLLMWMGFKVIANYTQHDVMVKVPDFGTQSVFTLNDFIKDKKLRFQIIDSIYDAKQKPGLIIRQDPEKESEVKEGRVIYLTVTSVLPPQMQMPNLVNRSLRQAIAMIESYGLKAGRIQYVADYCKNCVLKQIYKGKEIEAGTTLKKGSVIDLQIGKGNINETIPLPNLLGMTFCDAKNKLLSASLQIGNIMADKGVSDTCEAFVYRHIPSFGKEKEVGAGAKIDVYITADKDKADSFIK